jgi:hypothetical protein
MLPKASFPLRTTADRAYDNHMAKAKKFDLESPAPTLDKETRKRSPPSMKAFGIGKPAESCPRKKSADSYQGGFPQLANRDRCFISNQEPTS